MINKSIADLNYESKMAHDIRFDASDAQPNYIGLNFDTIGNDDALNWVIYKFTYSGTDATRIQKANGSWTNRASLF